MMAPRVRDSRALLRELFWRVLAANVAAGLFIAGYLSLITAVPEGETRAVGLAWGAASMVALIFACGGLAYRRALQLAAADWRWLDDRRAPDERERRVVLSAPRRLALLAVPYWAVIAVLAATVRAYYGPPEARPAVAFLATLLGGVVGSALSYFAVERRLRPLLAEVLHGAPPDHSSTLGLRARLMLAWALGAAIPFVAILLTPTVRERRTGLPLSLPVSVLAVAGLAASAALSRAAGRSIADPIAEVRAGLRRVRDGHLDTAVVVDDGGDIGLLQAGFNRMVEELRERQRVQELFGRHVGEKVARRALEVGVELGGEQREVSVFFADVIGSTHLAEVLAPGDLVSMLNDLFDAVVKVTAAEGGWVNKFEGDAALCVFGAPDDQPDHAERALRAARELRRRLAALRERHHDLDVGIGVASGTVVAGNVGAENRFEYTVIGTAVNVAARLTETAKHCDGRVLAHATSVQASGEEARWWRSSGAVTLRGITEPVPVAEPLM